jgi:fucose permease
LGWLFAGIVGGVASLPFQQGYISETRQTLFSIWALGLLAMVLLGFVRSIVRLRRDRLL